MSNGKPPYHEKLLHWLWKHRQFSTSQLQTGSGDKVIIHNTGTLNKTDGADFRGADITVGDLRWHGDVEIHWNLAGWKAHGHHADPNFEQVILHVIFEEEQGCVTRSDGTSIPTLCLSPLLRQPLKKFMAQYRQGPDLPCSGHLSFISEEAFAQQIQKAHKEYFEQKVEDLLEFYDPTLPPSKAWQKMFAIALFDGLGISHNREPMQKLATELFDVAEPSTLKSTLKAKAIRLSEIENDATHPRKLNWNHKGVRPANHPRPRMMQGAECLCFILQLPFQHWMRKDPELLWEKMVHSISTTPSLGTERSDILFGTVFLPALYSLGNLFFCEQLKSQSWELWLQHRVSLPQSLLTLFSQSELPTGVYAQKLGTIRQLRNYCKPKNCQQCKVFKSVISS
ncbi:Protein of unknown function (DUF2851) [Fodinibius salinus]|uniref:DUF2851 domain-containing protein n=1 Tax=Fodinibius salinus TaxID=860790 RepID=A0A5D3YEC2_9BACT|nr:DUF2851 family protein [Fodinibius salinus]TYP91692.1 Protein of unknown function (DUF2851) [Fodinibius salinus]